VFEKLFKYSPEQFAEGTIRFGLRPELVVLAVLAAVAVAVYFYRRRVGDLGPWARGILMVLRGLVLALLVVILVNPMLEIPRSVPRDAFVAVLADDSASMGIEDTAADASGSGGSKRISRLAAAKAVLGRAGEAGEADDDGGLLERIARVCPVRLFRFAARPERIEGPAALTGRGERTNLYSAMKVIDTDFQGVPVAAVVLLTDGAATAGGRPQDMARRLAARGTPVFCLGFGVLDPPRDREVLRVQAPKEVRRNTTVEVFATVRVHGYSEPFDVVLLTGSQVVHTVPVTPTRDVEIYRVRLTFQAEQKGTFRFAVQVPPATDEIIRRNNRSELLVKVADRRLPVLYLEGSPREEYRFLRRALYRDEDFRIVSILRLDGPKKFLLQGAEPADGLEGGYPKTREHLSRFEAIIFGDVEAGYLTAEQLEITEAFVREKGRGFLMLGGVNSFNLGAYQGTPIEKMLPVVLPGPGVAYRQVEFNIAPTRIGERHPAMRQSSNVLVNRNIWSRSPTLVGYNPIRQAKRGAEVLAIEPASGSPVLTVQRYGAGRAAAFTTGGSWHWRMALPIRDKLHEKFWRQLVRYLAVGARGQVTIDLTKDLFARDEPVSIRATVLDRVLNPANDATVLARISRAGVNPRDLPMEWILSVDGVYQTQFEPDEPGDYELEVVATFPDGSKDAASTTFSVGETLEEYTDPGQKDTVLKEVAALAGGSYYTAAQAGEAVEQIQRRVREMKHDETVYERLDLWDTPLLFGLLVLLLAVEWLIRRRAGLM
jgi:uncharacterized membrane protein